MNQKNLAIIGLTVLAVLVFSIVFPFWFYIAKIVIAVAIIIYFAYILRKKFKNDAIG